MNNELPLEAKLVEGALDIGVGESILRFAAEHHPDLWNGATDTFLVKVTDPVVFAKEVLRQINREEEDGSTPLSRMLDAAILAAVDDGCEGIDIEHFERHSA